MGAVVHMIFSTWEGIKDDLTVGKRTYKITFPLYMFPGTFTVTPWVKREIESTDDQVNNAIVFHVEEADITGHKPYFNRHSRRGGEVYVPSKWSWE